MNTLLRSFPCHMSRSHRPFVFRHFGVSSRCQSSKTVEPLAILPERPSHPSVSETLAPNFLPDIPSLENIVEPSLSSLGLASYWPPGRIQAVIEFFHVSLDVPWWAAISLTTIGIRFLIFPIVIKSQKNAAHYAKFAPQVAEMQSKISEARKTGNVYEVQKWSSSLAEFMKKNNVSIFKNFLPIILQVPIFISMFTGLRNMSKLPVPSFVDGGLLWFSDLSLCDPLYILPFGVCASTYLQFHLAADGINLGTMGVIGRTIMKAVPFCLFPFLMNFPSAMTWYWFTTNIISVLQAQFIRTPFIRSKLGIPPMIDWVKRKNKFTNEKEKSFRESVNEAIDSWKVAGDAADRRLFDEQRFRQAGEKSIRKTYKFDPTKRISPPKSSP